MDIWQKDGRISPYLAIGDMYLFFIFIEHTEILIIFGAGFVVIVYVVTADINLLTDNHT